MSADILGVANVMRTAEREQESPWAQSPRLVTGWNPGKFIREQMRGLVRQVFSASGTRPVRQIVFSAVDPATDVRNVCRQVGESLALETLGGIAVVGEYPQLPADWRTFQATSQDRNIPLRETAARMRSRCTNICGRSAASSNTRLWRRRPLDRTRPLPSACLPME